jgi:hypothetical protein
MFITIVRVMVLTLGLAGCHTLAAIGLIGVVEQPCDPDTFVNTCADERTMINCTRARNGLGLGSGTTAVVRSECHGDNTCVVLDGWAECVSAPTTTCDPQTEFSRCHNNQVEQCRGLHFWRGFERWDGQLAAWVSTPEPCTETPRE